MTVKRAALIWLVAGGLGLSRLAGLAASPTVGASARSAKATAYNFGRDVKPILSRYCYDCHGEKKKGDLDLRIFTDERTASGNRQVFEKVLKNLQAHEMPPENKPQPSEAERELITSWVASFFFPCDCEHPDPGRVTLRRLNRAEYNNTIRDLVGVAFQPADDFPSDDAGYGFDNIGDVLSLSPVLLEKYLAAAERILDTALRNGPRVTKFQADKLEATAPGGPYGSRARILTREGEVFTQARFPEDGEYILRARAFGQQAGPDPARMEFRLEGKPIKVFDVKAVEESPGLYELKAKISAGEKRFGAAYINNYVKPDDPDPAQRDRNLIVEYLEVAGPVGGPSESELRRRIFICEPTSGGLGARQECARKIVASFASRAFRRPVKKEELERLIKLFDSMQVGGQSFEDAVKLTLETVLVSPHFLFREEPQAAPDNPKRIQRIDQYALASRLSYFLWSTMPDEELFAQAARGSLRGNLDKQIKRMLADKKAQALAANFAGQWLQLRNLKLSSPDAKLFPAFDEGLRGAMERETTLFFESVLQEDRSVLTFLDADYTFLNEKLARLYQIEDVQGEQFRRVTLRGGRRGGLLTQASVLTLTSNPTRTSPVKRGKWVLENLLGAPPPPPPPNVPKLAEEGKEALKGSLRKRMEAHREDPACASCHARMDPIGFGFENFDGIGAWRQRDGEFEIESSGKLFTGETFSGPSELKAILLNEKRDDFVRCLTEKMLTYALGRGMEYYDKCALEQITKAMARQDYKFSSLILEVAKSTPFQFRRGG